MPFLNRLSILEPVESWSTLHAAAEERFWDGFDLATSEAGRHTGAIYLFGYVAEMLLKVAFFRVRGFPAYGNVYPHLHIAQNHAAWTGGNLHSLEAWTEVLIATRASLGIPLDTVFASQLRMNVAVLVSHWRESLRYKYSEADSQELREVFDLVDWLLANRNVLWS